MSDSAKGCKENQPGSEMMFQVPVFVAHRESACKETDPNGHRRCRENGRIDAFRLLRPSSCSYPPHISRSPDAAKGLGKTAEMRKNHPGSAMKRTVNERLDFAGVCQNLHRRAQYASPQLSRDGSNVPRSGFLHKAVHIKTAPEALPAEFADIPPDAGNGKTKMSISKNQETKLDREVRSECF